MSNIEPVVLLSDEDTARLFLIAVDSVTKENDGITPLDQSKLLGEMLVAFANQALQCNALLELIEDGKVQPYLENGELCFKVPA